MAFWKKEKELEEKTEKGFSAVKKDIDIVGKWIKHFDLKNKQLFDMINELKIDLSTMKDELESVKEGLDLVQDEAKSQQVFKKMDVLKKQTPVFAVEKAVQTAVQTANFYDILKELSNHQRLIVLTLMNNDMKLSYEDLAMLLGKEKSTIRGQINAIKQKSEGLIEEIVEKSGKKRVYVPIEVKEKLQKYAKVRVSKNKKVRINDKMKEEKEIFEEKNEK